MAPVAVSEFHDALAALSARSGEAATRLVSRLDRLSPVEARGFITDAYPDVMTPFIRSSGELATQWYAEQPANPVPRGGKVFVPEPAPLPAVEELQVSGRWALTRNDPVTAIKGASTRKVWNQARKSMISNAVREGVGWVRVAQPDACGFCKMLATRTGSAGAGTPGFYASERAALLVVGGEVRRRGRVAGRTGVVRGSRELDEPFHDHCQCDAIAVRSGVYEPPMYVQAWQDQYDAAVKEHGLDPAAIAKALDDPRRRQKRKASVAGVVAAAGAGAAVGAVGAVAREVNRLRPADVFGAARAAASGAAQMGVGAVRATGVPDLVLAGAGGEVPSGEPSSNAGALDDLPTKDPDWLSREADVFEAAKRDSGVINPNWRADDDSGTWTNNCVRCVVAYELRRRGYDVEATGAENGQGIALNSLEKMWRHRSADGNPGRISWLTMLGDSHKEAIDRFVENSWPEGARGVVVLGNAQEHGGGAHVFTVEVIDGKAVYFDPQIPADYHDLYKAERNFATADPNISPGIMRIDNMVPARSAVDVVAGKFRGELPSVEWLQEKAPGGFLGGGKKLQWTPENVSRWWNDFGGSETRLGRQWIERSRAKPNRVEDDGPFGVGGDLILEGNNQDSGTQWLHPDELARYFNPEIDWEKWDWHTLPALKQDIAQNGILNPVTIETDGTRATLMDGHHRVKVAQQLGIRRVPVRINRIDFSHPSESFVDDGLTALLEANADKQNAPLMNSLERQPSWAQGEQGDDMMLTGRKRGGGAGSAPVSGEFGKVASRLPKGTEIKPIYKLNKDGSVKMTKPKLKDDGTWTKSKPMVDVAATWDSVSDDVLDENLRLALRQAQPWAVEAGTTWYPGVRKMATRLTGVYADSFRQQHGVELSPDILGGLISVFSRNNGWIRNIVGVRQYLDDPFAEKRKVNKKTGEITMVKPMHVTMTGGAEDLIAFVKERHAAGETDDHAIVEAFFASYPTAPKPHRFWRSIMGDEDNSAIDRWMARVQLHTDDPEFAEKMRSATKTVKGVKDNYGYHRLEASIKRISREPEFAGYTATALQACPWVHLVGPEGVLGDIQDLSSDKAASAEAKRYVESMGWRD